MGRRVLRKFFSSIPASQANGRYWQQDSGIQELHNFTLVLSYYSQDPAQALFCNLPQAGSEFFPQQSQNDSNFSTSLREKASTRGGQRVHCIYQLVFPTPQAPEDSLITGRKFLTQTHAANLDSGAEFFALFCKTTLTVDVLIFLPLF